MNKIIATKNYKMKKIERKKLVFIYGGRRNCHVSGFNRKSCSWESADGNQWCLGVFTWFGNVKSKECHERRDSRKDME